MLFWLTWLFGNYCNDIYIYILIIFLSVLRLNNITLFFKTKAKNHGNKVLQFSMSSCFSVYDYNKLMQSTCEF